MTNIFPKSKEAGNIMIFVAVMFVAISMTVVFSITAPVLAQIKSADRTDLSKQSYYLAEAGVEDVMFRLKNNMDVSDTEELSLNGKVVETTVTSTVEGKTVRSEADVSNYIRKVQTKIILGSGVAFNYALQTGVNGFEISGGSTIEGNVYSNGPISGGGGSSIEGAATSALSEAPAELYVNDSPTTPTESIIFGTSNDTQDLSQSFTADDNSTIDSVSIYLKKTNYPSNLTVRITPDNGGEPKKQTLATASLESWTIGNTFDWYELPLSSSVSLTAGQTYWIVIDGSSNSCSQYYCNSYEIGSNTSVGGQKVMLGRYNNNVWTDTNPTGQDAYMRVYAGGVASEIAGTGSYVGSIVVTDRAWAKSVRNARVDGELWCQTATMTNTSCDTSHSNPPAQDFPVADEHINGWKADAESGWIYTGNLSVGWQGTTTGPVKIDGDLSVNGGGTLTLTGNMWVTGDVTINGGGKVILDSSFGNNSGVLVSDGLVDISGGGEFAGSGQTGSYPIVVTTNACPNGVSCGGDNALEISGGAGAVLLIAQNGTLHMNGGTSAKALSANKISISGGGRVTYESGLADLTLSANPDGGWNIQSWDEIE